MYFKDRSFCASDCVNSNCPYYYSEELKAEAKRWWENGLVAYADRSKGCDDYKKPKDN